MPYNRPTLPDLIDTAETDIEARLPDADARLRASNLNVLARVLAGGEDGLYNFIDWASKQILVDTAEAEMLDRHASVWGVARTPAAFAQGNVTITGTSGTVVPAGTRLRRSDNVTYATDAEATLASGTATVAVTAETAAAAGNASAAAAVSLVSPIAGITTQAAVASGGLTGGADTETDASLRLRVIDRIQQPPHGGAGFDYVKWALEFPGVTHAWVYSQELGIGTVTVRFMMVGTYDDGIPLEADVTALQSYLDALRPVTAALTVVAPVAVPLNITTLSITPSSSAVQAAIEAEVADLILREAEPGATILISHLREAISIAAGETDHVLSDPSADIEHDTGEIAVVGTFPWSA
ncbi:MAG: baseplate J/gp47 family protein [Rhodospirillales bacterium]